MKFAKSLMRNEVPEWSHYYIDYKSLKKLVNQAAKELREASNAEQLTDSGIDDRITAPLFYAIDRNVERVDSFYNAKFAEYTRRLRHVEQQRELIWQQLFKQENESDVEYSDKLEATGMLLELRSHLRNLQWYAEINKQGFMKILKKFDKKVGTNAKTQYMTSKINILGFCNGQELVEKIDIVSKFLQEIAPEIQGRPEALHQLPGGAQIPEQDLGEHRQLSPLELLKLAIDNDNSAKVSEILAGQRLTNKEATTFLTRAVAVHADTVIPLLVGRIPPEVILSVDSMHRRNILHRVIISEGRKLLEERRNEPIKISAGVPARALGGPGSAINGSAPPDAAAAAAAVSVSANGGKPLENGKAGGLPVPVNHSGNGTAPPSSILAAPKPAKPSTDPGIVETQRNSYQETCTSMQVLIDALSHKTDLRLLTLAVDHQLRTPVHYTARYGLAPIVELFLKLEPASLAFNDSDGLSPMDLAVLHRHPRTLHQILKFSPAYKPMLLITAAKLNASAICEVLVTDGKYNVNFCDDARGETALHFAVKHNHLETVKVLIKSGADLEIRESLFGWTPLFLAAVDGLSEIAEELLAAGARADLVDNSGWSAKEHAALRGHLSLAEKLPSPPLSPTDPTVTAGSTPNNEENEVLKTFGHRYLDDDEEKLVLVTLGSRDLRQKSVLPVELDTVPVSEAGNTQLDTALSLIVHAEASSSASHYIDLPVPELGLATEPIPFFTKNINNFNLVFDLVPTYRSGDQPIARGVYIPPKLNKMQDLNLALQSVLIIEANSLRILGRVNFEMLVVKPFCHPNNSVNVNSTYWRSLITTRVIGHRGLGKNTLANSSLQLGENTVESFIQAANLGASYVEFDVQLTKDEVPVIYHDFLVGDSGFDIPMHAMTKDQFMNIHTPVRGRTDSITPRPKNSPRNDGVGYNSFPLSDSSVIMTEEKPLPDKNLYPTGSPDGVNSAVFNSTDTFDDLPRIKKRSNSVNHSNRKHEVDTNYDDAYRRMRFTRDFKRQGYKGNVRGLHIQSKFATLEELFKTLPSGLGFNIEFKYPMLDEAEAEEMDGSVVEINRFVDTILKVIFDNKKERDIIISSFNPDVCILLSLKQPSIPVLFLTEGGTAPMMDIRASSLQEAVRFSKRFNLLGIVSAAQPLIMCPRLVRAVKDSGLVCFTYGTLNNVPENARVQLKAGVDAVIVDSVLAIRKELTDYNENDVLVQELSNSLEKTGVSA